MSEILKNLIVSDNVEKIFTLKDITSFIMNEDNHTEGEMGNSCIDVQTLINHFTTIANNKNIIEDSVVNKTDMNVLHSTDYVIFNERCNNVVRFKSDSTIVVYGDKVEALKDVCLENDKIIPSTELPQEFQTELLAQINKFGSIK